VPLLRIPSLRAKITDGAHARRVRLLLPRTLMRCEKFRGNSRPIEPDAKKVRKVLVRFGLNRGT